MAFTLEVSWDRGRSASRASRKLGAVGFTVALHAAVVGSLLLTMGGGGAELVRSARRLVMLDVKEAAATVSPTTVSAQPVQPKPIEVIVPPIVEWSRTTMRITRTITPPPPMAAPPAPASAGPSVSAEPPASVGQSSGGFDPYAGSAPVYRDGASRAPVVLPPSALASAISADAPGVKAALRALIGAMPTAHGVALLAVRCEGGRVADVHVRYGSLPAPVSERLAALLRRSLGREACGGRSGEIMLGPLQF